MHIGHVGVYTSNLERLKTFYERYFGVVVSTKYVNEKQQFASYFLSFPSGARLEIMSKASVVGASPAHGEDRLGWSHTAVSVGLKEQVDALTARLAEDGYTVLWWNRWWDNWPIKLGICAILVMFVAGLWEWQVPDEDSDEEEAGHEDTPTSQSGHA